VSSVTCQQVALVESRCSRQVVPDGYVDVTHEECSPDESRRTDGYVEEYRRSRDDVSHPGLAVGIIVL